MRRLVLVLAWLFGLLCLGSALLVLRAVGWRAWPLAMLLTVLTAAAWTLVLAWVAADAGVEYVGGGDRRAGGVSIRRR